MLSGEIECGENYVMSLVGMFWYLWIQLKRGRRAGKS